MAKADYHLCPVCGGKTFYDSNGGEEDEYYVALHHKCLAKIKAEARDEALADSYTIISETIESFIQAFQSGNRVAIERARDYARIVFNEKLHSGGCGSADGRDKLTARQTTKEENHEPRTHRL